MSGLIKRFLRAIKGAAGIEFAIILPLLLLLFFGSFEVGRYIMVSRKVDNFANDIGFLLSREGSFYDLDQDGTPDEVGEDVEWLEDFVESTSGLMLFPYENYGFAVDLRYIGIPTNPNEGETYSTRMMWSHCLERLSEGTTLSECTSSGSDVEGDVGIDLGQYSVINSSGQEIYSDNFGERTRLNLAGQGFILSSVAYDYQQVLNNLGDVVGFVFGGRDIARVTSYPARARWNDANLDNQVQANEFFNELHVCIGCQIDSDSLSGTSNASSRGTCVGVTSASSGCDFR